jgi:hypothetical protein
MSKPICISGIFRQIAVQVRRAVLPDWPALPECPLRLVDTAACISNEFMIGRFLTFRDIAPCGHKLGNELMANTLI